jgi:tol-pal system protein YbgF
MMLHRILAFCTVLALPLPAVAQTETLADIRQQLTALFVDVQALRSELATSGALSSGVAGATPLDRLNVIEAELQRLTSKAEELEFRINRVTVDGTNRIGDLEFRLCELEPGCDISTLGDTPSLGGSAAPSTPSAGVPAVTPPAASGGPAVAIGEQDDIRRAQEALASGDFRSAIDQLATFATTYPGSPLSADAAYIRGQAHEALGENTTAARAYLEAFSADPAGPRAPESLYKLGASLGAIGQTQDACLTLAEVNIRFPGDAAVGRAQAAMQNLGCR